MTLLHGLRANHPMLRGKLPLLVIGVLGIALLLGLLATHQPMLAISAGVVVLLCLAILAWPDISTLAVIAILFSNAAVIAVRFHGVPYFFATSVPLLLIVSLANYLFFRRQKLIVTPVLPLLFIFLLIQALSTLFSNDTSISMGVLRTFMIEGILLYFLITNVIRTPQMLQRVIWVVLITGAFIGGLSLLQQITQTYSNNYGGFAQVQGVGFRTGVETIQGEIRQSRLAGPIGEKNYYAQIMLMLVPLGLFRFWGERSNWLRPLAITAAGLTALGGMLAFSRGAAVAAVLMLLIMTFLRYIKLSQLVIILLGVVLLLQVVPQYTVRLTSLQSLSEGLGEDSTGIAGADSAVQGRWGEMLAAGLVFVNHPVTGVGPGMFKYYYEDYSELTGFRLHTGTRVAHNLYLHIAAETGIFGLVCFLAILFVTLRNLAQVRKRWIHQRPELANMATGFMLAIISYMTSGIFLSLAYERYLWIMLALAGAASYIALSETLAETARTVENGGELAREER